MIDEMPMDGIGSLRIHCGPDMRTDQHILRCRSNKKIHAWGKKIKKKKKGQKKQIERKVEKGKRKGEKRGKMLK